MKKYKKFSRKAAKTQRQRKEKFFSESSASLRLCVRFYFLAGGPS